MLLGILTFSVLSDGNQGLRSLVQFIRLHVHANELNIIVQTDDAATLTCFYIFFADVARLVIEKSVRVATPSDASHEHPEW
jgi:hypothetical protein